MQYFHVLPSTLSAQSCSHPSGSLERTCDLKEGDREIGCQEARGEVGHNKEHTVFPEQYAMGRFCRSMRHVTHKTAMFLGVQNCFILHACKFDTTSAAAKKRKQLEENKKRKREKPTKAPRDCHLHSPIPSERVARVLSFFRKSLQLVVFRRRMSNSNIPTQKSSLR